jgi:hypothetical protein|tara:strand:- start:1039 stop:1266 length:228 start_codon:yes stop_codon:yes gene_type:complete
MSDDYNDLYTVQETADLLETNITNVYALIRANVLRNANLFGKPPKITRAQILWYLNNRVPSKFKVVTLDDYKKVA